MSLWTKAAASQLLHRVGIYVFSSGLTQGIMLLAWLYLPWKLTVEEVGQFALLSFVIDLLSRLVAMGMDSALPRFYVDANRRARVFASAGCWLGVGSLLATAAIWFTWNIVPAVFNGLEPVYHHVAFLVLGVAIAVTLANTILVHYIASHKAGRFGQLNALRSLILAGGYMLGASAGLGLIGLLFSQLIASLAVLVIFWLSRPFDDRPVCPEKSTMRELLIYSFPMLFYGLFSLVSEYSGRLALESQVSLGAMGIFQFYNQIANQINGVWTSINRAWTPYVFQRMEADLPAAFARITRFSLWGTLACAAGIMLMMLLNFVGLGSLLVPPAYLARIDLFYLLLLGPLFCSIYTAIYPVFYFDKNTLKISLVQSLICLLTICLTFAFTVRFKSEGAALSWPLGIFLTPIIYVLLFPSLRVRLAPNLAILLIWGAAGTLMAFALLYLHSTPWAIATLVLGATGTVFLGRSRWATKPA